MNEKSPGTAAWLGLRFILGAFCSSTESHALASKTRAAVFPAAQNDRSRLLRKVRWKGAMATQLCISHSTETLEKGVLPLESGKGAEE